MPVPLACRRLYLTRLYMREEELRYVASCPARAQLMLPRNANGRTEDESRMRSGLLI